MRRPGRARSPGFGIGRQGFLAAKIGGTVRVDCGLVREKGVRDWRANELGTEVVVKSADASKFYPPRI